ncbi:DUF1836 domain-containing protein [Bacillus carboniphilus]|uniref:DUF1836 domain-containing protein n=1 Tax=Bacillus carboniphilus TaxID=86663 RepID=A0ABY9JUQ1_9BACI|nr:DUF1836 domain-containing protein [Bacillus carboniphilus]WLR43107.1 DUF1836 domain-containing protein [Bacillus carboniphilus]
MEEYQINRKTMARLLRSLKGELHETPRSILQNQIQKGLPEFLLRFERKKPKQPFGLSTNDIVSLGNLCELTSLKSTSVQNWIKRDVKEVIGSPELGKKYSIEQAALLLVVRDLKATLDFEAIRHLLSFVFNTLSDRSDDLLSPLFFYEQYALALDHLKDVKIIHFSEPSLEAKIDEIVNYNLEQITILTSKEKMTIRHIISITVLSVLSSHIQRKALIYYNCYFK